MSGLHIHDTVGVFQSQVTQHACTSFRPSRQAVACDGDASLKDLRKNLLRASDVGVDLVQVVERLEASKEADAYVSPSPVIVAATRPCAVLGQIAPSDIRYHRNLAPKRPLTFPTHNHSIHPPMIDLVNTGVSQGHQGCRDFAWRSEGGTLTPI